MLLLWFHPLVIQLMMVRIKVFLQVAELEKNSWRVSLNPINQACVSVGVELKKKNPSEPGPLQNAAHLCFRLQAVSCSALSLAAQPAPRYSFPRLPRCKQFAVNSFKTGWFETITMHCLFIFPPVESNN